MKRGILWSITIIATLALWLVAVVVLFVAVPIYRGDPAGRDPIRLDIAKGSSLSVVANGLHDAGVVLHPRVFERFAVIAGFDRQIRPGEYDFVAGESYKQILERLRQGDIVQVRVTIPEGYSSWEIANLFERKLKFPREEFLALLADEQLLERYNIESPSLEGYLFPDTYLFPSKSSPLEVTEILLQRFFTAWTPAFEEMARGIKMTRAQVLTLASIVEGEALLDSETRRISAVYHNRLQKNMRLQADPTVLYALGGVRRRVLYRDLRTDSPYNTYRYQGLPPGPICSPGLVAIEAALNPLLNTGEIYFVAARDGRGGHVFSETLRQHINAKRRAARLARNRRARRR